MKLRDIKTKKPWRKIRPEGYHQYRSGVTAIDSIPSDTPFFDVVTQSDFLREYYPSGHTINDPTVFPDIYRMEDVPILDSDGQETGKVNHRIYRESVPRLAFAFQRLITVKHLVHLCGNDVQFELKSTKASDKERETFSLIRTGWLAKDMEIAFYDAAKSVKITADTAFVAYLNKGKFFWKVLSFTSGDVLYPHFSPITGKLMMFAREFSSFDAEGNEMAQWLEVWDDRYMYRYRQGKGNNRSLKEKALGVFGVNGYELIEKGAHGFCEVPVAYHRNEDGPCWSFSQDSISEFEISASQMAQNNKAFGEPILTLMAEGSNVDITRDISGSIKILTMGPDDKAGYLQAQSASDSYMKQQDQLYKMIFTQSFIVDPPELKSGDLPAAALKILYSPAYEMAIKDCKEFQVFLNDMVRLFLYAYGVEMKHTIDFTNLDMKWWLEPYVHINSSTVIADLASAVQNGFISRQTASERIETLYATNSEWDRIMREEKERQTADLLYQLKATEIDGHTDRQAD